MNELHPRLRQLVDAIMDATASTDATDQLAMGMNGISFPERERLFFYWDRRKEGCSPKLAEMLALQQSPMSSSDREFCEGRVDNGHLFGHGPLAEDTGNKLKKIAEAGGQNVKGKMYVGSIARFPGDPEAWVSDRGDVKRVVEKRGWKCQGAVEHNPDGHTNELDAAFMERRLVTGPGLDRAEDGVVETLHDGADSRQKIDKLLEVR